MKWGPAETFETGFRKTIDWYLANPEWIENVTSGAYKHWIEENYADRQAGAAALPAEAETIE